MRNFSDQRVITLQIFIARNWHTLKNIARKQAIFFHGNNSKRHSLNNCHLREWRKMGYSVTWIRISFHGALYISFRNNIFREEAIAKDKIQNLYYTYIYICSTCEVKLSIFYISSLEIVLDRLQFVSSLYSLFQDIQWIL